MIDVILINTLDLFKTMCNGTAVSKFNEIIFKASGKTFKLIQEDLNKKIRLTGETPKKSRPGKKKRQEEYGDTSLTSNCLLLQLSTEWYWSCTVKDSNRKISSLEYLGYSEPRLSRLVNFIQEWMGMC